MINNKPILGISQTFVYHGYSFLDFISSVFKRVHRISQPKKSTFDECHAQFPSGSWFCTATLEPGLSWDRGMVKYCHGAMLGNFCISNGNSPLFLLGFAHQLWDLPCLLWVFTMGFTHQHMATYGNYGDFSWGTMGIHHVFVGYFPAVNNHLISLFKFSSRQPGALWQCQDQHPRR